MASRIFLGMTLSLSVGVAANAAPAQIDNADGASVVVRFSDLDLSRPDGAKALLGRLRVAASVACGGRPSSLLDLAGMQAYRACMRTSLDSAVSQVRAPLVAALYRGHDEAMASVGGPG